MCCAVGLRVLVWWCCAVCVCRLTMWVVWVIAGLHSGVLLVFVNVEFLHFACCLYLVGGFGGLVALVVLATLVGCLLGLLLGC